MHQCQDIPQAVATSSLLKPFCFCLSMFTLFYELVRVNDISVFIEMFKIILVHTVQLLCSLDSHIIRNSQEWYSHSDLECSLKSSCIHGQHVFL